jgi:hypothetical protein
MTELSGLRQAIQEFALEPTGASLPNALGFTHVPTPRNLIRTDNPFSAELQPVASAVHRCGYFATPQGHAAIYIVRLNDWGVRSSDRDRARRRIARTFVQYPQGDSRWLIVLIPPAWQDVRARDASSFSPAFARTASLPSVPSLMSPTRLASTSGCSPTSRSPPAWISARSPATGPTFSVQRVTDRFYREFREFRERLVAAIQTANPGNPLVPLGRTSPASTATSQA